MKVNKAVNTEGKFLTVVALSAVFVLGFTKIAAAYVGPGAALSLLGSLLGLIGATLMALAIVLFWPMRMMIRRMRQRKKQPSVSEAENAPQTTDESANYINEQSQ